LTEESEASSCQQDSLSLYLFWEVVDFAWKLALSSQAPTRAGGEERLGTRKKVSLMERNAMLEVIQYLAIQRMILQERWVEEPVSQPPHLGALRVFHLPGLILPLHEISYRAPGNAYAYFLPQVMQALRTIEWKEQVGRAAQATTHRPFSFLLRLPGKGQ
jgi:hypothetical protein